MIPLKMECLSLNKKNKKTGVRTITIVKLPILLTILTTLNKTGDAFSKLMYSSIDA